MHELSLMQQVVDTIQEQLAAQGATKAVKEVRLTVGALDIHSEAAFCQAFEVLSQETPLAGAKLNLTVEPARMACHSCGSHTPLAEGQVDPHYPSPYVVCPQCGTVCELKGGRGVLTIELLVDDK